MKIFLLFFVFLANLTFSQTNYYVNDQLGSDIPGNGTAPGSSAWKSINFALNNVANPSTDQIVINISGHTYDLGNTQVEINRNFVDLTLYGEGKEYTILQPASDSLLSVSRVVKIFAGNTVSINNLTIRYGRVVAPEANGGGLLNEGGNLTVMNCHVYGNYGRALGAGFGGGIANLGGNLTIFNTLVSSNVTVDSCYGGGVGSENGTLNILNSTISNNFAHAGGGIAVLSNGSDVTFNLLNSTVYGNTADFRFGGMRISVFGEQPELYKIQTNIISSTITNNTAADWYGGIGIIASQDFSIKNSIVAGNNSHGTPDDITGSGPDPIFITSGGYNIIQTVHTLNINGDQNNGIGLDPGLLPLADNNTFNGTPTCAITSGSPAKDQIPYGSPNGAPELDQRGYSRIGNYDIGAYEYPGQRVRTQFVQNSAGSLTDTLDLYINDELVVDNFVFRTATSFLDLPAGENLNVSLAPSESNSAKDAMKNVELVLEPGTSVVLINGLADPENYIQNPDAKSIELTLSVVDNAKESSLPGETEFFVFHGVTDAPAVEVRVRELNDPVVLDSASYGDYSDYFSLSSQTLTLDFTTASGTSFITTAQTSLSELGSKSMVIFASGFADPSGNNEGPQAAIFAALADGTVFGLTTPSLSGDYYIPQGTNRQGFPNLADAVSQLNANGVSGTTRFLIDADLTENGLVLNRGDLSKENNLVIKPAPGKSPVITLINFPSTGNASNQGLTIENCSFVTIDGSNTEDGLTRDLTITGNHSAGLYVIGVIDNSDSIVIKNLNIRYTSLNANSTGFAIDGYTGVPEGVLVKNCSIGDEVNSFRTGVGLFGNSNLTPANAEVIDNLIYAKRRGITTFYIRKNIYTGNTIYIVNPDPNQTFYAGIYVTGSEAGDTTVISNNRILKLSGNTTTSQRFSGGVVIYGNTGVLNVFNNFIATNYSNAGTRTDDKVYGIVFGSATWNGVANIYHNTIVLSASAVTGRHAGIGTEITSNAVLNIFNNIIVNNQPEAESYGIHWTNTPSASSVLNSDYNNIYMPGLRSNFARFGAADITDLGSWRTASGQDQNSISKNVEFVSNTDLHITGNSNGDVELASLPVSWITRDIDSEVRNLNKTYMGADESSIPVPVQMTSFTAAKVNNGILLKWTTATEVNSSHFNVERRSEEEWVEVGKISAAGTSTSIVNYEFIDQTYSGSKIYYRLKQVDFDGSYVYSNEIEIENVLPEEFSISQNYPNPFNPTTRIDYNVPVDAKVIISVYALNGEHITDLVNEEMKQGSYTAEFDGRNLASGMYIYKMSAGNFTKTQKMILIK